MVTWSEAFAPRVRMLLVCGAIVLGAAFPARADEQAASSLLSRMDGRADTLLLPRCITPAAGHAFEDLIEAGAVRAALPSDFSMTSGVIHDNEVELKIEDAEHHAYAITLALTASNQGRPDGQGRNFLFYFAPAATPADARAASALLALASLFDGAVPDAGLVYCGANEPHSDRRYPRGLILASAVAEGLVVLAAIIWGMRAIRSPSRGTGCPSADSMAGGRPDERGYA